MIPDLGKRMTAGKSGIPALTRCSNCDDILPDGAEIAGVGAETEKPAEKAAGAMRNSAGAQTTHLTVRRCLRSRPLQ